MDSQHFRELVEADIRERELIPPGGAVTCLVSGDVTPRVSGTRSASLATRSPRCTSTTGCADASLTRTLGKFCCEVLGAEIVDGRGGQHGGRVARAALLVRHRPAARQLCGHTVSDQVETVLYRLVSAARPAGSSGARGRSRARSSAAPVRRPRPTAGVEGLDYRSDSSNADTKRLDPRADPPAASATPSCGRGEPACSTRERSPLADLLAAPVGSKRLDLGGGLTVGPRVRQRLPGADARLAGRRCPLGLVAHLRPRAWP